MLGGWKGEMEVGCTESPVFVVVISKLYTDKVEGGTYVREE